MVWYEYSEEEYLKDEKEISREEGFKDGQNVGEAKFGRLNLLLLQQNRLEDLKQAAQDPESRQALYKEFGLSERRQFSETKSGRQGRKCLNPPRMPDLLF